MQSNLYRKRALMIGAAIGLVFVLCLIYILIFPSAQTTDGLTAHIYQDGTLIQSIDLGLVTETYEINISDEDGNYNIIEIRPGSVGITDASCPDLLCVHMGFQSSSLLPITCLPNKVIIRIERSLSPDAISGQTGDILDGITY